MNTIRKSSNSEITPLFYHFKALAKKLYTQIDSGLDEITIDRYYYLLYIVISQQQITQQNLCKKLNIDKASMVRIIDYLSSHGYVSRLVNPDDRRSFVIIPTSSALNIYDQLVNMFIQTNTICLKGFTSSEIKKFYSMLDRITQNLENYHTHHQK